MGVERVRGKVEKVSFKAKDAHVRVSIRDNEQLNLAIADRGVIQEDDEIRRCTDDERCRPLAEGSRIRVDREMSEGRKIIAWAPVT